MFLVSLFIIWEFIQIITLKTRYIRFDNLIDLANFTLIVLAVLWDLTGNDVINEVQWVKFLLMWKLIIFKYIRVFKPTRKYVKMIMEVLRDVTVFMIMLFIIILAYMHLLVILSEGDMEFRDSFKISYTLSFGELDETRDDGWVAWINFMIFSFTLPLVLMNLLIAILSDSYGHVMETAVAADIGILIGDILEVEEAINYLFKVKQKY